MSTVTSESSARLSSDVAPSECTMALGMTQVSAVRHVEIWEFDPAWWRIEWKDEEDQSLGHVCFERRLPAVSMPKARETVRLGLGSLWQIVCRLREAVSCRLSTN